MKNTNKHKNRYTETFLPGGMDLSPENDSNASFSYLKNLYIDYEGTADALESIPGFRRIYSFDRVINGIYSFGNSIYIHAGDDLYCFDLGERDRLHALSPIMKLKDQRSLGFALQNRLIILDGETITAIDKSRAEPFVINDKDISLCTIGAVYDGRLLIAGSPLRPNKIHELDPDDGSVKEVHSILSHYAIKGIYSVGEMLIVADDVGISAYKNQNGEFIMDKSLCGLGKIYDCISYLDEALMLCDIGLIRIRDMKLISTPVSRLLTPKIERAKLGIWKGYLSLMMGEEILLLDGRKEKNNWYYIADIGSYRGDRRLFRYAHEAPDGYSVHEHTDGRADGEVMSLVTRSGETVYYTELEGERYNLYPTEQFVGGEFYPASLYSASYELMIFATECGDICLFNSDMRGVVPQWVKAKEGFDPIEYSKNYKNRIHPYFYSFAGHAAKYELTTTVVSSTDKKLTSPRSLSVKYKTLPGKFTMWVKTDEGRESALFTYGGSQGGFDGFDFSKGFATGESQSINLSDHKGKFLTKEYSIRADNFASPIGIMSISHGYRAKKN